MDLRDWEMRTGALDGLLYDDDYDYDGMDDGVSQVEYEEAVFQGVLDKIRQARTAGEPDVQLSPEELEIYRARLMIPRMPAAQPQAGATRVVSAPVLDPGNSAVIPPVFNDTPASVPRPGSSRSSKNKQRTSFFSSRPKKEKSGNRKRAPSSASQATSQLPAPPSMYPVNHAPGFIVPGPNGQPTYAPVNALPEPALRDPVPRPPQATDRILRERPPRPAPPDMYTERMAREAISRARESASQFDPRLEAIRRHQPSIPLRPSTPSVMPGAFPSESHLESDEPSQPQQHRPTSSSRKPSAASNPEVSHRPTHASSSFASTQQPAKLVPFPVPEYHHQSAGSYQYQLAGQAAASTSASYPTSSQPPPVRRAVSGPTDSNYAAMPRRVPVPVQRATAPMFPAQGSYSDPALGHRAAGPRAEMSDGEDATDVDVAVPGPQADESSYKVQTVKPGSKGGDGSGGGRANERRRRTGHTRKKN
jgi:hypothetical protein